MKKKEIFKGQNERKESEESPHSISDNLFLTSRIEI